MVSISSRQIGILLIPILLGAFLLLYGTSAYGVGVSKDSVGYLSAARNIALHGANATDITSESLQPLTIWPVAYPALLALLYFVDADVLQSARILNVVLFGLYIAAIQLLTIRSTRGSLGAAVAAGLFVSVSYSNLYIFSRAWSETLFLVLSLFGLLLLGQHLVRSRWSILIIAGLLFALAWLTRYIGVTLLLAGLVALLCLSEQRVRRRIMEASVFVFVVASPMLILIIRNRNVGGDAVSREVSIHNMNREWWIQGFRAMSAWLIPAGSPPILVVCSLTILIAVVGSSLYLIVRSSLNAQDYAENRQREWVYPAVLLVFIAVYVSLFYAVVAVSDPPVPLGRRTLSPVFSAIVVVGAYVAYQLYTHLLNQRRALSIVLIIVVGVAISFQFIRSAKWSIVAHDSGLHYNTKTYQDSLTVDAVRALPENAQIYSNNPQLLYFLTNRKVSSLGQRQCDIACSTLTAEFQQAMVTSGKELAIVWTPTFDKTQCGACLTSLAPNSGLNWSTRTTTSGYIAVRQRNRKRTPDTDNLAGM